MSIPRVFISYSHDSQGHKKWVLDFATRLRSSGVDAILDQWELKPGDDLPHFMETNLAKADYIIMICTERYVKKANQGTGGVGYEKMIITSELLTGIDANKVIPVIRQNGGHEVPTFLKSKLFLVFSNSEGLEFSFDELLRTLHDSPLYEKPEVGNNPFKPVEETRQDKAGDIQKLLMKLVIGDFENGLEWSLYRTVVSKLEVSRILADITIAETARRGLLRQHADGDLTLTKKGKLYAVQNGLV